MQIQVQIQVQVVENRMDCQCLLIGGGNGVWYPGVIARILTSNKFDIQYDDGDEIEKSVARKFVRFENSKLKLGQIILGNWLGRGNYYCGRVVKIRGGNTYDIYLDSGNQK